MTVTDIPDLTYPLRACAPWCFNGDGHPDEHPDDRSCWSDFDHKVPLRHHEPQQMVAGPDGCEWWQSSADVLLRWRPEHAEATVVIHTQHDDRETVLSLDEARLLRDHLTAMLERAGASQ